MTKAIDNFDLSQNVKFSTYAVPMIIGEIRRYLRDNNPIRVSRSLRDIAYRALQVRDKLMSENSKEPTIEEIAKILDVPKEEVVFAMDAIQEPISLFEPIYHDGGDPVSYTHLDVYKRQVLTITNILTNLKRFRINL